MSKSNADTVILEQTTYYNVLEETKIYKSKALLYIYILVGTHSIITNKE